MNGNGCCILFEADTKTKRAEFKKICRRQNMSMTRAFNCLMDQVVDGQIVFTQKARMRKKNK